MVWGEVEVCGLEVLTCLPMMPIHAIEGPWGEDIMNQCGLSVVMELMSTSD